MIVFLVGKVNEAQEQLSKARELSSGKDWNAKKILESEQRPLNKECGNFLCRALIATGKDLRLEGKADLALPLIHKSYKLCEGCKYSNDISKSKLLPINRTAW